MLGSTSVRSRPESCAATEHRLTRRASWRESAVGSWRVIRVWLGVGLLVALGLLAAACAASPAEEVVVYTSLDQVFSEPVLRDFEAQTGIRVKPVYDVEAAKTTGLVNRLVAERSRPQADVFWSSEFAQTLRLKDDSLLDAYDSPAAANVPAAYRDPERYWTGIALRARVILVNTDLVPPEKYPRTLDDLLDPEWGAGEVGIANPLFGTTASHAAALFAALGPEDGKAYFAALRARGARVVDGNSVVRDMVARGELKIGLTDTDDAKGAVEKGAPVAVIYPDQSSGGLGTLLIPNTVALVRNAPHPTAAKKLVDYLLSTEVEAKLVRSGAAQMPVRASVEVPADAPRIDQIRPMAVSAEQVAAQLDASAAWLKEVFLQ
jgi:iron(III) transport system substrate-binding protein